MTRARTVAAIALLLCFLLLLSSNPAAGAAAERPGEEGEGAGLELLGQIGGAINAITMEGDYTYIGLGPRLAIVQADPSDGVTLVGQTPPLEGLVFDIAVADGIAYVAAEKGGLYLIDVSNPARPQQVSQFQIEVAPFAWRVEVRGSLAYVASRSLAFWKDEGALSVIDVSDPDQPELRFTNEEIVGPMDLVLSRDLAYVLGLDGLTIFRLEDPEKPEPIAVNEDYRGAEALAVANDVVYVAYSDLYLIDSSDAAETAQLSAFETPGRAFSVAVFDEFAFLGDGEGLSIVDVSDPTVPRAVTTIETAAPVYDVAVDGEQLWLTDREKLYLFDVSDPSAAQRVDVYESLVPGTPVVDNGYVYTLTRGRLLVFDVDDPAEPRLASFLEVDVVSDHALAEDTLYLTSARGLHVIDVSVPTAPEEIAALNYAGGFEKVMLVDETAYLLDEEDNFHLVDIRDPARPVHLGSQDLEGVPEYIDVSPFSKSATEGMVLCVHSREQGLHLIANRNRTDLEVVSTYEITSPTAASCTANNAYVVDYRGTVHILEIDDPANPRAAGTYDEIAEGWSKIEVIGNRAYIVEQAGGLHIVDISSPMEPVQLSYQELPGIWINFAVAGDKVYISGMSGLLILGAPGEKTSTPPAPTAAPAVPGPASATESAEPAVTSRPERAESAAEAATPLPESAPTPAERSISPSPWPLVMVSGTVVVVLVAASLVLWRRQRGAEASVAPTRFCPHCGAEYPPSGKFCIKCGKPREGTGVGS